MDAPKFDNKDKLADFLKATLQKNSDLIQESNIEDIEYQLDELYNDEADMNYEASNC